jgi:hypothetical protein
LIDPFPPGIDELIREAEREVDMRRKVYPRTEMRPELASYRIRCMQAIVVILKVYAATERSRLNAITKEEESDERITPD